VTKTKAKKTAAPPEGAHDWVSFPDPEEDRTWVVDVTFLLSKWRCIFGDGCQGVLTGPAPELEQGCCSYGAHFIDEEDVERVKKAAATLTPDEWQFHQGAELDVVEQGADDTTVTRLVDGACVFLNRPGWKGGPGCALHAAALGRGERPMDLKPTVCWQLPLRREDETDATGHVTSVVREWDRRHWGEGGFGSDGCHRHRLDSRRVSVRNRQRLGNGVAKGIVVIGHGVYLLWLLISKVKMEFRFVGPAVPADRTVANRRHSRPYKSA